jgi:hypothetical protein
MVDDGLSPGARRGFMPVDQRASEGSNPRINKSHSCEYPIVILAGSAATQVATPVGIQISGMIAKQQCTDPFQIF